MSSYMLINEQFLCLSICVLVFLKRVSVSSKGKLTHGTPTPTLMPVKENSSTTSDLLKSDQQIIYNIYTIIYNTAQVENYNRAKDINMIKF